MIQTPTSETITSLIQEGEFFKLKEVLKHFEPAEVVALLEEEEEREQLIIFRLLPLRLATEVFEYLSLDIQKHFLANLSQEKMTDILNEMSPDDRTALLEFLPDELVRELIQTLSEPERKVTLELLGYPEYSVGRLMTPDYIAIRESWTVQQVLDYIRRHGGQSETLSVLYVTDHRGVLIDDIRIREVLLADPQKSVSEIMDRRFVSLKAMQDQEEAIEVFRRNDRVALPVVNNEGVLFGIVTIDDILDIREEEDTEDIQKLGGSEALDEPYLDTPVLDMVKKRAGWLVILLIGEMLTTSAMHHFEDDLQRAAVLGLFIPLIISAGGNAGSQATSLIIRAMSLGEFTLSDWWLVMRRELVSGALLGAILGVVGSLRIVLWAKVIDPGYFGPFWPLIAVTVGISLLGIVLWGALSGAMLPMLLKRLGLDPATASAPFVATLVDVTGLIIYFSVATLVLRGTLL
ncbi:magnesium transporter [Hymenobacter lutimineralis]|uniref:Magnesium transporter MgtE n=1 Tax=Hymenobacter lutimineralis TaxID=2606448 RepID=A0A5D6V0G4_9BACT|nr:MULTISPECIES: magnesium transporter [Hymenobacter]QIX61748.1 magnesium transporter [Hymenobacter sp. BT18]TYZ09293.1 magnesium transporter [Hymenobacter lutimineralis]